MCWLAARADELLIRFLLFRELVCLMPFPILIVALFLLRPLAAEFFRDSALRWLLGARRDSTVASCPGFMNDVLGRVVPLRTLVRPPLTVVVILTTSVPVAADLMRCDWSGAAMVAPVVAILTFLSVPLPSVFIPAYFENLSELYSYCC